MEVLLVNHNCNKSQIKIIDKRELVFSRLRKIRCRITNQRKLIIDIILADGCSSCKEIYYEAKQKDTSIGIATVYRMVKVLEEVGAIDRKNFYHIPSQNVYEMVDGCSVILKSKKTIELTEDDWKDALQLGLREKGILRDDEINSVVMIMPDYRKEMI